MINRWESMLSEISFTIIRNPKKGKYKLVKDLIWHEHDSVGVPSSQK